MIHKISTILLLTSMSLFAKNYYVSKTGNDANLGTENNPLLTIQKAVNSAIAGDSVFVKAGTYNENVRIYKTTGQGTWGTANAPIVYKTFGTDEVIINGGGGTALWIEGEYIEFHNFKLTVPITNAEWALPGLYIVGKIDNAGSGTIASNHLKFVGVEIYDCGAMGILAGYDSHHNEFLYLKIHHNRDPSNIPNHGAGQGYYMGGDYCKIIGNEIYNNQSHGIQLWASTGTHPEIANPTGNIISGNLIYNNGDGYPSEWTNGIAAGGNNGGDSNLICNNIIYGNNSYGIELSSNFGKDNKVYNNTIYGNKLGGLSTWSSVGPGTVIKNNIVFSNGSTNLNGTIVPENNYLSTFIIDYNCWDPAKAFSWDNNGYYSLSAWQNGSGKDQNSIASDPLLVNTTNQDFHLQSGSPCIDAGTTLSEVPDDFAGNVRPSGSAYDIGAYEYGGTPVQTYSISGTILDQNSQPLSGSTVTAGSKNAVSQSNGSYTISGLTNGNYTVTPSKTSYTFIPASRSVAISNGDVTSIDFSATLIPNPNTLNAYFYNGSVVINGDLSEFSVADVISFSDNSGRGSDDNGVVVKAMWDATNFYIGYEVTDTKLNALVNAGNPGNLWEDDQTEVYFDTDHDHATREYVFNVNINNYQSKGSLSGLTSAIQLNGTLGNDTDNDGGYMLEIAVPWSNLGITPVSGKVIGMDFCGADLDQGAGYQYYDWMNLSVFDQPDKWGDVVLAGSTPVITKHQKSTKENYEINVSPNPFTIGTKISYFFSEKQNVTIELYSIQGEWIKTLVRGIVQAGEFGVNLSAEDLPAGVYLLTTADERDTDIKQIILFK